MDLSQFPDSPYAEQLRSGGARLHFSPAIEADFRYKHLERARWRARVWGGVTAVFALAFTLLQVRTAGPLHAVSLLHYGLVPLALMIGWLPWSRFYQSHYLAAAGASMPIVCALTAPFSAQAAAEGRYEVLILLALQIVGIFQFTGLLYRMAVVTCLALVTGFAVGTAIWELPVFDSVKYILTLSLATFSRRHFRSRHRSSCANRVSRGQATRGVARTRPAHRLEEPAQFRRALAAYVAAGAA